MYSYSLLLCHSFLYSLRCSQLPCYSRLYQLFCLRPSVLPHQFHYYNDFNDEKTYSQTGNDGLSEFLLLTTLKVDNAGLNVNFNNYYFGYLHNEILNIIELQVNKNETVMAYLDTSAPVSTLSSSSYLINSGVITLHFNITSEKK